MRHYSELLAAAGVAGLLLMGLAGCKSPHPISELGGGYEEMSHASHSLLPGDHPPRISLDHLDPDQQTKVVWPSLFCRDVAVQDDLAIFVADKSFLVGGQPSIHPRLFAVRSPAPPVDLTQQILWLWAKANGKDLTKTFNRFSLAIPENKNGKLAVHLEFWSGNYLSDEDWPETGELNLDWPEVARLMNSITAKGIRQRDPRWHTPYIAEPF